MKRDRAPRHISFLRLLQYGSVQDIPLNPKICQIKPNRNIIQLLVWMDTNFEGFIVFAFYVRSVSNPQKLLGFVQWTS